MDWIAPVKKHSEKKRLKKLRKKKNLFNWPFFATDKDDLYINHTWLVTCLASYEFHFYRFLYIGIFLENEHL